ncbi:hypothetical protein forsur_45 [Escherichia phage forsur]|nr:hypothetical protein forsur_45 [Escherichia phage forsur]
MFRVLMLFVLVVILWGALWVGVAYLIQPYIGEQLTSVIGTLLGLCCWRSWYVQVH